MTIKKTTTYKIATPEGLAHVVAGLAPGVAPPQVGDTIDLHLEAETETALIAAGWLTTEDTGPKGGTK